MSAPLLAVERAELDSASRTRSRWSTARPSARRPCEVRAFTRAAANTVSARATKALFRRSHKHCCNACIPSGRGFNVGMRSKAPNRMVGIAAVAWFVIACRDRKLPPLRQVSEHLDLRSLGVDRGPVERGLWSPSGGTAQGVTHKARSRARSSVECPLPTELNDRNGQ